MTNVQNVVSTEGRRQTQWDWQKQRQRELVQWGERKEITETETDAVRLKKWKKQRVSTLSQYLFRWNQSLLAFPAVTTYNSITQTAVTVMLITIQQRMCAGGYTKVPQNSFSSFVRSVFSLIPISESQSPRLWHSDNSRRLTGFSANPFSQQFSASGIKLNTMLINHSACLSPVQNAQSKSWGLSLSCSSYTDRLVGQCSGMHSSVSNQTVHEWHTN